MDSSTAVARLPWYRSLDRQQWRVLVASNLGWLFDGYEIYALFLTVGFASCSMRRNRRPFRNTPAISLRSRCSAIVGLFFILGLIIAPFLPETAGKPLPETMSPALTS